MHYYTVIQSTDTSTSRITFTQPVYTKSSCSVRSALHLLQSIALKGIGEISN